jgi:CubicO group peptidase (beta-lactamase class C family)
MSGVGFGAPGSPGQPDQPWGHAGSAPVEPGPTADNPAAIGPAGTVHATMDDLALYFQLHLDGARGGATALLAPESFSKLHQPVGATGYACGWAIADRPWANGRTLSHAGSNTLWYAVVWIAPVRGFGVFAVTNAGGDAAARATDDAATVLIQRVLAGQS